MQFFNYVTLERFGSDRTAVDIACRGRFHDHRTGRFSFSCFGLILLTVASTAIPATANVGAISYGGQVVAEPIGIKDITITRETLTIDLRPSQENNPALVEATYQLQNKGTAVRHQLLFASGTEGDNQFEITLDDTVLASEKVAVPLPPQWKPPTSTPGIAGSGKLEYGVGGYNSNATSIAFTAEIGPGAHVLKVKYRAPVGVNFSGNPLKYHQFAYVLAPAKSWEHFGGLDVMIHYPVGWSIACTPEMSREGDILRGRFADIPADSLAITIQAPTPPEYERYRQLSNLLLIAVVIIGPIFCLVMGRRVGHRAKRTSTVVLTGIAFGLISAAVVAVVGWTAVYGIDTLLPANQISHYGYGDIFAVIGVIGLTLAVGIISTTLAVVLGLMSFKKKQR